MNFFVKLNLMQADEIKLNRHRKIDFSSNSTINLFDFLNSYVQNFAG